MDHLAQPLTIAGLAKAVDVNVATIRFYQRKELLRVPTRPPGGIRRYTDADMERVRLIKAAQRFGFSLKEIAHLLRCDEDMRCHAATELVSRHLADVRARLLDLAQIEATLANLLEQCRPVHEQGGQGKANVACPLMAWLHAGPMDKDVECGNIRTVARAQARAERSTSGDRSG